MESLLTGGLLVSFYMNSQQESTLLLMMTLLKYTNVFSKVKSNFLPTLTKKEKVLSGNLLKLTCPNVMEIQSVESRILKCINSLMTLTSINWETWNLNLLMCQKSPQILTLVTFLSILSLIRKSHLLVEKILFLTGEKGVHQSLIFRLFLFRI